MKTAAICIPAFDCAEYIDDLIGSLTRQNHVNGWKYDFRIGIDGCEKTKLKLSKNKFNFYWSEKNIGHGVMRNSLMYAADADIYIYFDADDIMFDNYIAKNIQALEKNDFVMFAKKHIKLIDGKFQEYGKPVVQNGGAMSFTKKVLDIVCGFRNYKCGVDTDLMERAKMTGIKIIQSNEPLYFRRVHDKALTRSKDTGIGSEYRKNAWAEMTAKREKGIIKIKPEIVELQKINF